MMIKAILKSGLFALTILTATSVQADDGAPSATLEVYSDTFTKAWGQIETRQTLATGFTWSEGPVWDKGNSKLWFTDVPESKLHSWSAANGHLVELYPSGLPKGTEGMRESGLNGLIMAPDGALLVASHGHRAIQKLNPATGERVDLTAGFMGKKFNSPNDLILDKKGGIFFTDPPYGLTDADQSVLKELPHNGVYYLASDGQITVIDKTLTRPNGVALSPDESQLYVAVSDPASPRLMVYKKQSDGSWSKGTVQLDMTKWHAQGLPGLPDGMVVADNGHVFATGPGGIFVLNNAGDLIARIVLDRASANCTLGEDGRSLFITNHDRLIRVTFSGKGA